MSEGVRRIAVVTDSTADIPAEIAEREGIFVVPLNVNIDGRSYCDGDLSQEEYFALMDAAPRLPTTSQPPIGVYEDVYRRALAVADEVVSIHISHALSGTIESARQAAEGFAGRVHIFDSLNLSWGLAFQVLEAARAAASGLTREAVLERASTVRDSVRLIVGVDSLDNLAKGGRIGKVSQFLGSLLDLKVTFTIDEGRFVPLKRIRGSKAALEQTLSWVREQMGSAGGGAFAVLHAMSADRAERLAEALRSSYGIREMYVVPVGCTISTHTGTGWGIAFVPGD